MAIRYRGDGFNRNGSINPTFAPVVASMAGAVTGVVNNDGSIQRALGKITASLTSVERHPLSRNIAGVMVNGGLNQNGFNPAYPWWLLEHCAQIFVYQPQQIWDKSARTTRAQQHKDLYDANPLVHSIAHGPPFHSWPMFTTKVESKYSALNKYGQTVNREQFFLFRDDGTAGSPDYKYPNTTSANASFQANKQAGGFVNIGIIATMTAYANIVADVLAGQDTQIYHDMSGQQVDMTPWTSFMNDGTHDLILPKPANDFQENEVTGTVVSVDETEGGASNEPTIVTLSKDVALSTTGSTLDGSDTAGSVHTPHADMLALTNVQNMVTGPSSGDKGFYSRQVIGYRVATKQVFLKPHSNIMQNHGLQANPIVNGSRFTINSYTAGDNTGDVDLDGSNEGVIAAAALFAVGLAHFRDTLDARVFALTGEGTGYGANISQGILQGETGGKPEPHSFAGLLDFPHGESFTTTNFRISPTSFDNYSGSYDRLDHIYDVKNADPARGMRALYFGLSHVRESVGGYLQNKPTGFMPEIMVWAHDYTTANGLDAEMASWFHAILCTEEEFHTQLLTDTGAGTDQMFMCDHQFLDLDKNKLPLVPLGVYTRADTETSPGSGMWYHSWAWATPQWGELGFFRRPSTGLAYAINMRDASGEGYEVYAHHLEPTGVATGTGFTPVVGKDFITVAEFAALYTSDNGGIFLNAGETLKRLDMSAYVNETATAALRALNPGLWNDHDFGPFNSHPMDANNRQGAGPGEYTLSNNPGFLHNEFDNGDLINQLATLSCCPYEVIWFEVIPAP